MTAEILIIDDERDIRDLVAGLLKDEGYTTRVASDSDSALESFHTRRPALVVLDIWLQGSRLDGLELLHILQAKAPDLPVLIISGHGNIETAVAAIKAGAYDYLEKPFKADRLILMVERALEASQLRRKIRALKYQALDSQEMVGSSPAMGHLRQAITRAGPTSSRVLIVGPCGSGKEVAARKLHASSDRAAYPFVTLNGASMTPDSVEEALFGRAGEGGTPTRFGALEEAHGGTLYLDEVGEIPLETQGKILRVLTEQSFVRIGETTRNFIDVRIISSTSRDLGKALQQGSFREDLFHRLAVVVLRIPSLSERRQDIPELVSCFIQQFSERSGVPPKTITADALAVLQSYDWPGNLRQLRNTIERLLIMTRAEASDSVTAEFLPADIAEAIPPLPNLSGKEGEAADIFMTLPLREAREVFERAYLEAQMRRFDGNVSKTALFVGMERSALHRKLKALRLTRDSPLVMEVS